MNQGDFNCPDSFSLNIYVYIHIYLSIIYICKEKILLCKFSLISQRSREKPFKFGGFNDIFILMSDMGVLPLMSQIFLKGNDLYKNMTGDSDVHVR